MDIPARDNHKLIRPLAGALVLAAAIAAALAFSPGAADGARSKILGATGHTPKPICPGKGCQAIGSVTGFQTQTKEKKGLFKAREDGHIVAWSVELGDPSEEDQTFFSDVYPDDTFDRYGSRPVANLAILKNQGKSKFKLTKKTPIVELERSLGEKPIFTLSKPIRIKKGRVVALTTPTWAPAFTTVGGGRANKTLWRASRRPDRCEGEDLNNDGEIKGDDEIANLTKRSKPQVKKGSTKKYGCVYSGARLTYWAYYVPAEKKKK